MKWITEELKGLDKNEKTLKEFGLLVGGIFAFIGAWLAWKGRALAPAFWIPGGMLMATGFVAPNGLKLIYQCWMTLAIILGIVVSTILLTAFYYLVMTPVGLCARIAGQDFLLKAMDPAVQSYWIKKSESPDNQACERQF